MRKFEKEYEECYISSSAGDDPLDTEAEFEALLKEHQFKENLAENYASKKFDAIPQHTLLDSSAVRNKVGAMSTREVTVEQVEEWWKNSTRRAKAVDVIEKEVQIVEVYNRIKQEIGMK